MYTAFPAAVMAKISFTVCLGMYVLSVGEESPLGETARQHLSLSLTPLSVEHSSIHSDAVPCPVLEGRGEDGQWSTAAADL